MLIEMHAHTAEHSPCSSVAAVELVRQVYAKGLQGIVLTDHHYMWLPEDIASLRRSAEVPDYFLILSGQEMSTEEFGDVLIYGASTTIPRGTPLLEIRRLYPEVALVWAHPYRGSRVPVDEELLDSLLDGIEIFNSNHTARGNSRGLTDWHRLRFTAIAGTDTHGASYAGTYPTLFDHPLHDIRELAAEIRQGRCRPFLKEIPRAGAHALVTEVAIGTKGADEQRERIIIRTLDSPVSWQAADRAFRIMAEIARHGFSEGTYRIPRPIDEDPAARTLIEQGLRGKSLYDKLLAASPEDGREYLKLAACWLARLHNCRLRVTPPDEFRMKEQKRLERYLARFADINHRHTRKARDIQEAVLEAELRLLAGGTSSLVQGHGDYHPKNVFVGQDIQDRRETLFVAAIDFESSYVMPPAFDVGCFLAQYRNQFFHHPDVLQALSERTFLDAYLAEAEELDDGFLGQVELYRARTNLSIAAYLIKVGLGESEDLWRVLVEAEKALVQL